MYNAATVGGSSQFGQGIAATLCPADRWVGSSLSSILVSQDSKLGSFHLSLSTSKASPVWQKAIRHHWRSFSGLEGDSYTLILFNTKDDQC